MTDESLTVGQIFASHTDRLPAVKLSDVARSGILVGQDSNGHIELAVDSVILPVDPDTRAELLTDPVTRAWLLTEAFARTRRPYLWAVEELATERRHVQDARKDRERLLDDVRGFLVERVRDGQLDQQEANAFLRRHHLPAYAPRLRVAYTVTGEFEIDGDHDPEDGRLDHLIAVDLDAITNVDRGTERHQVHVTATSRVDIDDRCEHA